ncbi:MAG TPA: SUMF1/EgtB/PvdO family nonheme iron enzyme [Pirellulales bacterium]
MTDEFDPYYVWLGIPPSEQPPNHYRLLGVQRFESHREAIENAADRQMTFLQTFKNSARSELSQRLLNEVSSARVCLTNPAKRAAYDAALRAKLAPPTAPAPPAVPVPASVPVSAAVPMAPPGTGRPAFPHPDGAPLPGPSFLGDAERSDRGSVSRGAPARVALSPRMLALGGTVGVVVGLVAAMLTIEREPIASRSPTPIAAPSPSPEATAGGKPAPVPPLAPAAPLPAAEARPVFTSSPVPNSAATASVPAAPATPAGENVAPTAPLDAPEPRTAAMEPPSAPASPAPAVSASPAVEVPAPSSPPVPPPARPRAREVFRNGIGQEFVWCPAGEFSMGSPAREEGHHDEREARHRVKLTKGFWLAKYETTQAEYEQIMGKNPSWFSPSGEGRAAVAELDAKRLPVEQVRWSDALEFCEKLSQREGQAYRLPSEAEWEYACRAGTTTPFSFGKSSNGREANDHGENPYGATEKGPNLQRTAPVGSYPANPWGFHDMHGNVAEWCLDGYATYPESANVVDPLGAPKGQYRMNRGGSWTDGAGAARSASRRRDFPHRPSNYRGFRVALSP